MKYLLVFVCYCSIMGIIMPHESNATVYFSWDGESGYQYMGVNNPHPGGGFFSQMGGNVTKPADTYGASNCAPADTNNFHYSVISNDTAAQGSIPGSRHSLKTPYLGVCTNEAFQRDTTIIKTPILYEGYMRFYQKWTGDWNSATVQQKFTKFYTSTGLPIVHFSFAPKSKSWRAFVPNIDGHFDKDGVTRYGGQVWVNASSVAAGKPYTGQNVSYDDFSNGLGLDGTDGELYFETNKWYALEFHWKINTDADTADAVLEAWVDGKKVFGISNFKFFNSGARPIIDTFELQHIYYNRTATDQPTYMDNFIISDNYIGPVINIKQPKNLTATPIK